MRTLWIRVVIIALTGGGIIIATTTTAANAGPRRSGADRPSTSRSPSSAKHLEVAALRMSIASVRATGHIRTYSQIVPAPDPTQGASAE